MCWGLMLGSCGNIAASIAYNYCFYGSHSTYLVLSVICSLQVAMLGDNKKLVERLNAAP